LCRAIATNGDNEHSQGPCISDGVVGVVQAAAMNERMIGLWEVLLVALVMALMAGVITT